MSIMDDLSTGDVIELSGKKKSFVLLWSSQPSDYDTGLIRIDELMDIHVIILV